MCELIEKNILFIEARKAKKKPRYSIQTSCFRIISKWMQERQTLIKNQSKICEAQVTEKSHRIISTQRTVECVFCPAARLES